MESRVAPYYGGSIVAQVAADARGHLHGIRGEDRQGDGILGEADHRRHLAGGRRTGELDARIVAADGVDERPVIDVPGPENDPSPRRRALECRIAFLENGRERGVEVDVVTVPDGHPEHERERTALREGLRPEGQTGSKR